MGSKLYQEIVRPYRALLEEQVSQKQINRADAIRVVIVQDEKVIETAYKLVEEVGFIPATDTTTRLTASRLQRMGREEVKALLHVTTLVLAEQETDRKKLYRDDELGEIAIAAMSEVYKAKFNIKLSEHGASTNFQR